MGVDAEMLVKTWLPVSALNMKHLSWDLAQRFGCDVFWINPPDHRAVEIVSSYSQDGLDIVPEAGETFVKVHLWTRYYGPHYERGDAVLIIAVARYLEKTLAPCAVFYGGDSSGVCAEPFDAAARDKLWDHFAEHGHWPYQSYFGTHAPPAPVCDFCDHKMVNSGWGPDADHYYCIGCGRHTDRKRDGTVVRDDWKKDQWP